jgi:hypothetical protein
VLAESEGDPGGRGVVLAVMDEVAGVLEDKVGVIDGDDEFEDDDEEAGGTRVEDDAALESESMKSSNDTVLT